MSRSLPNNCDRIPIMCGFFCIELADPSRVKRILQAPNAKAVRRHKDHQVVEIQLREAGDDAKKRFKTGNPLSYSSDRATEDNPQNVWALKDIPTEARPVFLAVLQDCAA